MAERLKEKVEEFFGCEYELVVEFTGLIRLFLFFDYMYVSSKFTADAFLDMYCFNLTLEKEENWLSGICTYLAFQKHNTLSISSNIHCSILLEFIIWF